jgi:N-acetylneuraminic acid mutarotase
MSEITAHWFRRSLSRGYPRPRRRARRLVFERLEGRALPSATTLLWSSGVTLPAASGGAAATLVSGSIIELGGKTTGSSTAVNQLSPGAASWTSLARIDTGRVGPGLVATPNGLLVYGGGGGSSGTNALSSALLYQQNSSENENYAALMSTPRRQFASAGDGSALAYAIGGVNSQGTNLASVEQYNYSTNTWTTLASLPASRSGAAAAYDGSGSIYVVGGSATVNGTTGTNTLYQYTIASNTWTTLAALPINIRDAAAVFAPDGTLEVIGGISNGTTVASVESYNPASSTWTTNTALPAAVSSATAVVDSQGRVEVIGGLNSAKAPVAGVEVSQVVTQPTAAPVITSSPGLSATEGGTYSYQVTATSNPLPSFSLVSAPSGMTINPVSGLVSWSVPLSFTGAAPVTVQASNSLGTVQQPFTINVKDTIPPTTPGTPTLVSVTATTATITWAASSDNVGVTGYSVYWVYSVGHSGRGGGITTYHILEATTSAATTVTITGLTTGKSYNFEVVAKDAAGNTSLYSGGLVVNLTPPTGLAITGLSAAVANHNLTFQLSASSPAPITYSAVNPPAGLTIAPNTGVVNWTPSASELGTNTITLQATNLFGSSSLTVTINVAPDVPVPGFVFTNTSSPTFNVVGFSIALRQRRRRVG